MLDTNFSIVDYLVFVSLLIASSLIGVYFWYKSRNTATNAEYLIGNRQLSLIPVIMSMAATFMSTNTLLGMPAEVYQVGTQVWLTAVSCIIAIVLTAEVFMPIYYTMGFISVNEVWDILSKYWARIIIASLVFRKTIWCRLYAICRHNRIYV